MWWNLAYLAGALLMVGGFLIGLIRAERNETYEPVLTKYAIWSGAALLLIHGIFHLSW
jgi:hypothetical protein